MPSRRRFGSSTSFDSDAESFFTSAGITSSVEKQAWSDAVVSLKAAGLYTKFNRLYPFIGPNLSSARYCAKTLNQAASFNAPTYALASGVTMDGMSQALVTNFAPDAGDSLLTSTSGHYACWVEGLQFNASGSLLAATDTGAGNVDELFVDLMSTSLIMGTSVGPFPGYDETEAGFLIGSREGNDMTIYQNGLALDMATATHNGYTSGHLGIGGRVYDTTPSEGYLSGNFLFVSIGAGLSAAEIATYQTIVETFFDAIGRAY